jgi:hypothetical protein
MLRLIAYDVANSVVYLRKFLFLLFSSSKNTASMIPSMT